MWELQKKVPCECMRRCVCVLSLWFEGVVGETKIACVGENSTSSLLGEVTCEKHRWFMCVHPLVCVCV